MNPGMNPGKPGNGLLTVGDVAQLAGVSVDTVRGWERQGMIRAIRTPGEHRRFARREVEEFIRRSMPGAMRQPAAGNKPGSRRAPRSGSNRFSSPWEPEIDEAQSELAILRAKRESESIRRSLHADAEAAARGAREDCSRREVEKRLGGLRAYGRNLAAGLPTEWRAEVTRDLEEYVSERNFPTSLDEVDARSYVEARVEAFRERHRQALALQAEENRRQERVAGLIRTGEIAAVLLTQGWAYEQSTEARRIVERELRSDVDSDWTEDEVRTLVRDVLEEWEEEGGEEDEDGWEENRAEEEPDEGDESPEGEEGEDEEDDGMEAEGEDEDEEGLDDEDEDIDDCGEEEDAEDEGDDEGDDENYWR